MQKRRNSIANALELRLFCIKPLKCLIEDESVLIVYHVIKRQYLSPFTGTADHNLEIIG